MSYREPGHEKNIEVRIVSKLDGSTVWNIFNTTNSGAILGWECEETPRGGFRKGTLTLSSDTTFPFSDDNIIHVYLWRNIEDVGTYSELDWLQWVGYVAERPKETTSGVIEIEVLGFINRIESIVVNEDYRNAFLDAEEIVNDLLSKYLTTDTGVNYNSSKVDFSAPGYDLLISFDDELLVDVLAWIAQYCAGALDQNDSKYMWYVDNDLDFVYEEIYVFSSDYKG